MLFAKCGALVKQIVKDYKAAVITKSNKPLEIFNIKFKKPDSNQVLVKILYSAFCSSQYGEISGIKGKDNYLPHCLGHEACALVIQVGTGVNKVKKNDLVVLHWMKSNGSDAGGIKYESKDCTKSINAGQITTFSEYSIVSENRLTKVPKNRFNLKILPLMGCSIPVAISTLEKILNIRVGKNILILGGGALGIPMIHYCKKMLLSNIEVFEKRTKAVKKSKIFGSSKVYKNIEDRNLILNLKSNFYDYIVDTTGSAKLLSKILQYPSKGKTVLVGVPRFNQKLTINTLKLNYGLRLLGSYGGDFSPEDDLLRYLNFFVKTNFNFKEYIDGIYSLKDINKLINDYKNQKIFGKALIKVSN